jgi:hypothetical protein
VVIAAVSVDGPFPGDEGQSTEAETYGALSSPDWRVSSTGNSRAEWDGRLKKRVLRRQTHPTIEENLADRELQTIARLLASSFEISQCVDDWLKDPIKFPTF